MLRSKNAFCAATIGVDGGDGQPEILQRLGNFDAGRIRDIET
jgi:hypothetical protein